MVNNGLSANGDVTEPLVQNNIEMSNIEPSDKRTRFQVNKVDNERSIQINVDGEEDDENGDDENLLNGHERNRHNSDTAHSNDTKYGKSFR